MKVKTEYWIIGGALLLTAVIANVGYLKTRILNKLATFIPSVEGFSSKPYWDISRYSWGYGTAAPGSTGTITREQAFADMVTYLMNDYATLKNKVTRSLNFKQWAALLSFSYNLGIGNALNLVPVINAGDDDALHQKWIKYVYASGVVNPDLVARRNKEFALWVS